MSVYCTCTVPGEAVPPQVLPSMAQVPQAESLVLVIEGVLHRQGGQGGSGLAPTGLNCSVQVQYTLYSTVYRYIMQCTAQCTGVLQRQGGPVGIALLLQVYTVECTDTVYMYKTVYRYSV